MRAIRLRPEGASLLCRPRAGSGVSRRLFASGCLLCGGGAAFAQNLPRRILMDRESEAQIDATQPCGVTVSRFAADPAIVVLDFPNLDIQGLMLDRIAALVEKARLPRDRVLDDAALDAAIAASGDTIDTYYYGHDYKAADLARFFILAQRQAISLNARELWLKQLLAQLGWLSPGANGAIITLPGADATVTEEMRAVILRHELSHGAFYTYPAYEAYCVSFWASLSDGERAAFSGFLGRQDYDTQNTHLMLNETQAYLVFTPDTQFFNADAVGMTQAHVDGLRTRFIGGMPEFWLTPMARAALPAGPAPAACPVTSAP